MRGSPEEWERCNGSERPPRPASSLFLSSALSLSLFQQPHYSKLILPLPPTNSPNSRLARAFPSLLPSPRPSSALPRPLLPQRARPDPKSIRHAPGIVCVGSPGAERGVDGRATQAGEGDDDGEEPEQQGRGTHAEEHQDTVLTLPLHSQLPWDPAVTTRERPSSRPKDVSTRSSTPSSPLVRSSLFPLPSPGS